MVANARKRSSGGGQIVVKNDGIVLASGISALNFEGGSEVQAIVTQAGEVTVYHPAPSNQPYWPTGVTDPITRATVRVSTPEGGEGIPFSTNGWSASNQSASRTASFIIASPGTRTGFGGDSTFEVNVFDADGVGTLDSYTTPENPTLGERLFFRVHFDVVRNGGRHAPKRVSAWTHLNDSTVTTFSAGDTSNEKELLLKMYNHARTAEDLA